MPDTIPATDVAIRPPRFQYLEWGPIIMGALGAAAISFVLLTFGSALGLSAVSPYPYRGLSAPTFLIVATLYIAMVQVCSYAAGGYLAGRMRAPWLDGEPSERHFRDGAHGFAVWALGLVISAAVVASGAAGTAKAAVDALSSVSARAAGGAAAGGAARVATNPADYATDYLLRPAPGATGKGAGTQAGASGTNGAQGGAENAQATAGGGADTGAASATPPANAQDAGREGVDRAPLTRVFVRSLADGSLSQQDRGYLAQVVAQQTGLPQTDAEKRVDEAYAQAKNAEQKARDAANEARKKTALAGFLTAATFAVACAAACVAAGLGGRDRDEKTARYWLGAARFW